ncbi:radical SAM protein [Paraburkholderia sp. RL17-347-BIC-D]|uniref:radical SAM protein n=1 Tax=Paraburkholderia sp. RL17-347-BIC-D TaxID=3031632 RepID=UPI0038B8EE89
MILSPETDLKAEILTRGVVFTPAAIDCASRMGAKGQNLVYNAPKGFARERPQELFLEGEDGYRTVVSCVSAHGKREPVTVDVAASGELVCRIGEQAASDRVKVSFVKQPEYYAQRLASGDLAQKYISACGYDELNIIPWKGCLISSVCRFCGVNSVAVKNPSDALHAAHLRPGALGWEAARTSYLGNLSESIDLALQAECYSEHMHVILISGNLPDGQLDEQADIYCDITAHIKDQVAPKSTEGIVAVITPPHDLGRLDKLKQAGVEIVVFNLEVGNDPWFTKYCPGKSALGRDYFIDRLKHAATVFGRGKSWTNFVLGLEPVDELLALCEELARHGIVSSANVLHVDEGSRLDCDPPTKETVIRFFHELAQINHRNGFDAFYCAKALRTSLSNEFQDGRWV